MSVFSAVKLRELNVVCSSLAEGISSVQRSNTMRHIFDKSTMRGAAVNFPYPVLILALSSTKQI